jgi:DNA-binding transcriptional LysR family regulator
VRSNLPSQPANLGSAIELRLLRYFLAVAATEHVGQAAARLHISQSPLSRQIQKLEELLGLELFHRERRRIRLTDAGRWLLVPAREMVERADALVRNARSLGEGEVGSIAIGFVSAALATGVLSAALRRLRNERPRVAIALRQASSAEQLAQLAAGTLDIALVHRVPKAGTLEHHRLLDQPYLLAVPRTGPLARGPIPPRKLDGQPWIAVVSDADRERMAAAWARAGFTPTVVVQVVEWGSALALVDAGVGLALVPASYASSQPSGVALRSLPWLTLSSPLSLVRRPGPAPLIDDVARWLVDAARAPATPARARASRAPEQSARERMPARHYQR